MSKRLDRSVLQTEVVQIFNAAIKSPVTRDVYERRLLNFLSHMEMTPGEFVSLAKNDPLGAEKKIIDYTTQIVAGRLVVYAGHPEQYIALITFGCVVLQTIIKVETISRSSISGPTSYLIKLWLAK